MTTIYLVRHGHYDIMNGSLTEQGKKEIKTTAEIIRDENTGKALILYSPAKRTKESARIIYDALKDDLEVSMKECWRIGIEENKIKEVIEDYKDSPTLILVSHQIVIEDYASSIGIYSVLKTGEYIKIKIDWQ